ncbi:Hypothetical protein CAP_5335 [Chondromyces apiculatus DSM 436]|uniref:Uncharacterized protein n=1 Tax=Chondromyces apiculatus DSM 436 TaxID=1192034 RepID=A0A017T399_9BACT|nr:Hypothetical protein CAP_5335 [Chondromyces apiculatus DSM 436]
MKVIAECEASIAHRVSAVVCFVAAPAVNSVLVVVMRDNVHPAASTH